jgi:hypothetical protein
MFPNDDLARLVDEANPWGGWDMPAAPPRPSGVNQILAQPYRGGPKGFPTPPGLVA